MSLDTRKSAVIDEVVALASRLDEDQQATIEPFLRRYYAAVAPADLTARRVPDLFGAAMAHWRLAQHRGPREIKVHVYTPDVEEDGWGSPHTVVDVVCDDMPFVVSSLSMGLGRRGSGAHLIVHPVLDVCRDAAGGITGLPHEAGKGLGEAFVHIEIDREIDAQALAERSKDSLRTVEDVRAAVEDWPAMRERALRLTTELERQQSPVDPDEVAEARALLAWICADRFVFLGSCEYDFVVEDGTEVLRAIPTSALGVLRSAPSDGSVRVADLPPEVRRIFLGPNLLTLTKANTLATVYRRRPLDYIGIKRFDASGRPVGEVRFLGLYTSAVERSRPTDIPVLRRKVQAVVERATFPPSSHGEKALLDVLETYPRDELFQASVDDLYTAATGMLQLEGRQQLRLFVRREDYGRFFSCLVFVPRDRYSTRVRERMQAVLLDALHGTGIEYTVQMDESIHARLHFIVRSDVVDLPDYDTESLQARLTEITRAWTDELAEAVLEGGGEGEGVPLLQRYGDAFPSAYRDDFPAQVAVLDIKRIDALGPDSDLVTSLYHRPEAGESLPRFKVFRWGRPIFLSEVVPLLENLGVRVVEERPYEVRPSGGVPVWICDFGLVADGGTLDSPGVRQLFEDAFGRAWAGEIENDGFNRLVLAAGLTWREASAIRAYGSYLRQIGSPFPTPLMADTLGAHADITRLLIQLFRARFDPGRGAASDRRAADVVGAIEAAIDGVAGLDEDRILRQFLHLVLATVRTNYFQDRRYLSFKFDPARVPDLPLPRPRFEVFVYSVAAEGIHLRGGKVARGGIRWSDRRADFRTEVLGLMKAQTVKNAVIVPVGAKGGFVIKRPPSNPEALRAEVVAGYDTFVRGLLDLTDNQVDEVVQPPPLVVRHDDDDTYLVVAADKGTATFSDAANGIASDYDFWLGDAFASGGSAGYDHKAMGITARGAWESVKRHFGELGLAMDTSPFTVVGIGDMSGDVFGNGMLLSRRIELVAAFDHRHIFLDPDPDPARSYEERQRLYQLPRSSWDDYDRTLISEGGGVLSRTAKSVALSPQVQHLLDVSVAALTPDDLIRAILRAPVDLLWNGGIGTYVKASSERSTDVGDKTNDAVRVDAVDLRCRVVAEGGNLGLTQAGRVEYALNGGRINTDAIDNSAGVDCSDHEVNVKILLNRLVTQGDLTEKQRNVLLADMTDEIARLVLRDNYLQNLALAYGREHSDLYFDVGVRYMRTLELSGRLDRQIEFLPSEDELTEQRGGGRAFTSPELAVLMGYSKIILCEELLASDLPADAYLTETLERYFPASLRERFGDAIRAHPLRRSIVTTCVANEIVNRCTPFLVFVLQEETGASAADIVRAWLAVVEVLGMSQLWAEIEALDYRVGIQTQADMLRITARLIQRAVGWFLHNRNAPLDIAAAVGQFLSGSSAIAERLPGLLQAGEKQAAEETAAAYVASGVPEPLAAKIATLWALRSVFDLSEWAPRCGRTVEELATIFFTLSGHLELDWLRARIDEVPIDDRWKVLGRQALSDDLFSLQAALAADAATQGGVDAWFAANRDEVNRYLQVVRDIKSSGWFDLINLSVAVRVVRNLARAHAAA